MTLFISRILKIFIFQTKTVQESAFIHFIGGKYEKQNLMKVRDIE